MHLVSCSQAREADDSVPTRFSISWPNMLELRKRYALRSLIKTLARMCFDTVSQHTCSNPERTCAPFNFCHQRNAYNSCVMGSFF
jgi:hypothetical protein